MGGNDPILKFCPNANCALGGTIIETTQKLCLNRECNSKLRYYNWRDDKLPGPLAQARGKVLELRKGNKQPHLLEAKDEGPTVLTSDCDIKGCPIVQAPRVHFPLTLFNRCLFLCKAVSTEWMAYLRGEEKDGVYIIGEELLFPKQLVHAAHVQAADDAEIPEGTFAAIHSHVNFSASFSGEDDQHFNHQVEFVMNRSSELNAVARVKLECGRFQRVPCDITLTGAAAFLPDLTALKAQMIEDKTYSSIKWAKNGSEGTILSTTPSNGEAKRSTTVYRGGPDPKIIRGY